MNSKQLIKHLESDGWYLVRIKGSHHQFKHAVKLGLVTVKHPDGDIPKGALHSIHNKRVGNRRLMMRYPVVLHTDDHIRYGVTVPDLAGCFSAGDSIDEALVSVQEAIALQLEGIAEEGGGLPLSQPIALHKANPDYATGIWAVVEVDTARFEGKAEKINITLPSRLLVRIDAYAKSHHMSRSAFLAEAAKREMQAS